MQQSHSIGGSGITADDDPRNLSPKLDLPIFLGAILLAAVVYFWVVHERH